MAKNRLFYFLFFLACLVFSAAYQSRISAVLLAVAILYPVIAAVFTVIGLFTLRTGFVDERLVHEKNEIFELGIYLNNNFLLPYAPAELECVIPDNDAGLFLKKQVFVCVAPLKKMRIFVPCMHKYRGAFDARISRITVYDPLKIIRFSRRTDSKMQLVFVPRKIAVEKLSEIYTGKHGTVAEQRSTGEKEDFSHVREYAMGDIFQMIHWKLTAKHDELMVKQYDTNEERRAVVLCNFSHGTATPSGILKQSDAVVETAVSISMSLMRSGVKTIVDTGTVEAGQCEISDKASFEQFYEKMSVLPLKLAALDINQQIAKYLSYDMAALFVITPVLNEGIMSSAQAAGEMLGGAAVMIYTNCTGKSIRLPVDDRRFIFAELCGDAGAVLPDIAERVVAEYIELKQ